MELEEINKEEVERFLRNVPGPVLVGVYKGQCSPCDELRESLQQKELPDGLTYLGLDLDTENGDDLNIAALLGIEDVPTVIGFCQAEEVGRTSDPVALDSLLSLLKECSGRKEV